MQFSTRQVQELAGIRREQLRHWKKVLPPLSGRDGRAEMYRFDEALALSIIAALVVQLGLPVSRLISSSSDIFALTAETQTQALSKMRIFVDTHGAIHTTEPRDSNTFAAVNLGQVLRNFMARLGPDELKQLSLPLA